MLLRIALKSLLDGKVQNFIAQNVRQHHFYRITGILPKPYFSTQQIRKFSDIDEDENDVPDQDFYQLHQLMSKHLSHKQNLDDVLMNKIVSFENIKEAVEFCEKEVNSLDKNHIIQLLMQTGKLRNKMEPTNIKNINELIERIDTFILQMNDVELGVCLLQLRLLGMGSRYPINQRIIEILLRNIKEKEDIESITLMMFTEMIGLEKDLYSKLLMVELIPKINAKFSNCDNSLEFYHLISCLNNIHPVLSVDSIEEYRKKINEVLDSEIITEHHSKIIFKTLNFLNFPHWSTTNANLIERLLTILQKCVPQMTHKELYQTNRALFVQYEPAGLIPILRDRAHKLLQETKDVELLQIVCLYCSPEERMNYVKMLKDKILKHQTTLTPGSDLLTTFFKILRLLRVSDLELCECFWTKAVNSIFSFTESELKYRILKYSTRYMNFNNNLGGTYRHIEFEKIVYEYCYEEMKTTSTYLPKDFSRLAAFVIAYGDKYDSIPPFVIDKLILMQEQFNHLDCSLLARGLEILHGFRVKSQEKSVTLDNQVEILQYILDGCTQRHIVDPNISLKEMNLVLSSFVRRRAKRDSQLFFEIINWYDKRKNLEWNSRTIRELCHSLQITKFGLDSACDQFFEYIIKNKDIVMGETVEKVLTMCYNISYFPNNLEALECCSEIIHRDFNIMNGLSVVQALLALTFYKSAPYELVSLVFHGDFIKRLEQEVQMAYSKDTYPQRVMKLVMELNRSICLDHPEYSIRWFQQNFIEAQMSKRPVIKTKFHDEIQRLLLNIVPNGDFLATNRVTPYGYRIDFEIHLDGNYNKFLRLNSVDYHHVNFNVKPNVNKIAILLLGFDTFCMNDINRLRGAELLRMRHLEMMNYKVIHVKKTDFNMLYENISAKIKKLKNLLQISG